MKILIAICFACFASLSQAATPAKIVPADLPEYDSVYTDIIGGACVTVDSSELYAEPEIDFLQTECVGYAGYKIGLSGGDLRYSLDLSFGDTVIDTAKPISFNSPGSTKVEWRFHRTKSTEGNYSNALEFTALIYRQIVATYDEATGDSKDVSRLMVMRLNKEKSCIVGSVPQGRNMNQAARKIADDPTATTCLTADSLTTF